METFSSHPISSVPKDFWCHTCRAAVSVTIAMDESVKCKGLPSKQALINFLGDQCEGVFCESLEGTDEGTNHPKHFEPFRFQLGDDVENSLDQLSLSNNVNRLAFFNGLAELKGNTK